MSPSSNHDRLDRYSNPIHQLRHITRHADEGRTIKIENLVGFTAVPVGLAGPLQICGHYQKDEVTAPLATVEATLIASVNRGCKAFQQCGGVKAYAMSEGMGRAPVFRFSTVDDAVTFCESLPTLEGQLREDAEQTSRFARLIGLTPHIIGAKVHLHFEYTCGDAAGQNMTEYATNEACAKLLASPVGKKLRIIDVYQEGQLSADKQMALGRGIRPPRGVKVVAWGVLSEATCQSVLHTSCARLHRVITSALEGAVRNSLAGSSVNPANVLAAIFIATGQDAASVPESCWAQLTADYNEDTKDLTLSLFFPSLLVGSIGGGTGYPSQKEGLEMIGCARPGRKWALAETIAAFALALDISTASSITTNTKATSHRRLARDSKL